MGLLTPDQLKEHMLDTQLVDTALQRLLDANEAEITRRCGALPDGSSGGDDAITETHHPRFVTNLRLGQAIDSVEAVFVDDVELDEADDEWAVEGQYLRRRAGFVWNGTVIVTYSPVSTASERIRVLIQLCKLDAAYEGYTAESALQSSHSVPEYARERRQILDQLCNDWAFA